MKRIDSAIVFYFVLGMACVLAFSHIASGAERVSADVVVFFSPRGGANDALVDEIDKAKKTIDVSAYSFTNASIEQALARAVKRGVKVRMIVDDEQENVRGTLVPLAKKHGIEVKIDRRSGKAHIKSMVIDLKVWETGSFNYSASAELINREEMVIVYSPELARTVTANFEANWKAVK
jgi:phosphatidylserine/phosphatidylglycerophosphate/cardiolipin synthase-like enzyme